MINFDKKTVFLHALRTLGFLISIILYSASREQGLFVNAAIAFLSAFQFLVPEEYLIKYIRVKRWKVVLALFIFFIFALGFQPLSEPV